MQQEMINLIREFPDRSIRWILETPDNVHGLMSIVAKDLAERLDFARLKYLNQTFILDNLRKREADMVFMVPFLDKQRGTSSEIIIYLLIEHQSTVDPTMPFRVLFYMMQLWDMQRREWEEENIPLHKWRFRPILPVVFYTGSRKWNEPLNMKNIMELPAYLEEFAPRQKILFLNLKSTDPDLLVTENYPLGWVLRVIQKEKSTKRDFEDVLALAIKNLALMPLDEQANWSKLIYFLQLLIYNNRRPSEHHELIEIISDNVTDKIRKEEVTKMEKTIAQALIEEGREEGREEGMEKGLEEGLIQGKYDAISLGLELKFGINGITLMEKIIEIRSLKKLDIIKDALKTARSLEEFERMI